MEIKNMNGLRTELMKREAGKSQVNIAQMSEVLKCLADIMLDDMGVKVTDILIKNAKNRESRKANA